jgi:Tol biopolymer transport system component
MKTKRIGTTVLFLLAAALLLFSGAAQQESAKQLFEKALHLEETKGDLEKAVDVYKRIVAEFPEERVVAAQSFYHLGLCYEKLGLRDAQKAYQNVVDSYPDQTATAKLAKEKLAALARAQALALKGEQDLSIQKVWSGPLTDPIGGISPDGKSYCFTDWQTGDLAIRELATGKDRRITDKGPWTKSSAFAFLPKWSPDGRSIAYSWYDPDPKGEHFEMRLIGLEETQPRIIFEHKVTPVADVFPVDWHPDGKRILTYFGRHPDTYELGFISVADNAVQVLKAFSLFGSFAWNFAISPDGRTIAYDRNSEQKPKSLDIYLLSTDGKREQCLVGHPAADQVCDWTADGRFLLFSSDRTGFPGLWIVEVKDGKEFGTPSLLKADMGPFKPIGCTQQNQFCYGYENSGYDVYMGEIDPVSGQFLAPPVKKVRLYEGRNTTPECSPDGKYFVYISFRGFSPRTKHVLCLYSLENDEIRELDTGLKAINQGSFPQWRPDGKAISLAGTDSEGRLGIYLFELESEKLSPLVLSTREEPILRHRWANDGQTLFLTKGETRKPTSIYARDLKTGEEKALTSPADDIRDFDISPDGKWLACVDRGLKRDLGIIPTAGGALQKLCSFEAMGQYHIIPAWSADGKYIFFCNLASPATNQWEVWRFSLEGKQAQKMEHQGVNVRHLSIHPDGRHMIFSTQSEGPSEVWMMENFLPKAKEEK